MELSPEQIKAVQEWAEGGADLGAIQKRLEEDFEIRITYMETRFLLDDHQIVLPEPEEEEPEEEPTDAEIIEDAVANPAPPEDGAAKEAEANGDEPAKVDPEAPDAPSGPANVSVGVDKIAIPGAAISGSATFTDGEKAKWYLDPSGRLGFEPETPGYRPPENDLAAFQDELSKALEKSGF